MFVCVCLCVYVHMSAGTFRGQKRPSDALKLELRTVVSCLLWVLGTEPWSFANDLNHRSVFRALRVDYLKVFHNVAHFL